MANTDSPQGLVPIASRKAYTTRKVYAQSGYATDIFVGDAVIRATTATANTSEITTATGSYGIGSLEEVIRASVGDTNVILGVIVSIDPAYGVANNYGIASTDRVITICDDPQALYEIQADGTLGAASAGLNAVLIDTHTGSTVFGTSGTELDTTSDVPAADASNQLIIVRAVDRADNDTTLANSKWIVRVILSNSGSDALGEA